ncbi:hypothetical protein LCGC14_1022750 [marine sediment metagenome]|uniref:Uncharacterized protein n=1 Tax=marine sediment metagenome TaxID=412755 RepID=A0A0F9NIL1_9ZZZZ
MHNKTATLLAAGMTLLILGLIIGGVILDKVANLP